MSINKHSMDASCGSKDDQEHGVLPLSISSSIESALSSDSVQPQNSAVTFDDLYKRLPESALPKNQHQSDAVVNRNRRRRSYAQIERDHLSVSASAIRKELLDWNCKSKKCGECLSSCTDNALELSWMADNTLLNRKRYFANKSTASKREHVLCELKSLLRPSNSSLQYVIGGTKVCRAAWRYGHGFGESMTNTILSNYNKQYAARHPTTNSDLKKISDHAKRLTSHVGHETRMVEMWTGEPN